MKGYLRRGRAAGSWYLRVDLGRDATGKRQQRRVTVNGTKAEAQKKLRDLLREVETGTLVADRHLTFAGLSERWLDSVEHRIGARAHANYRAHVEQHIVPAVGAVRLEALRPAHVEQALAAWISGGRADRRKDRAHLSRRTVAHIFSTLRAVCAWGVRMQLLPRNPAEAVEPPKVEQHEMQALDAAGVAALLAAVRGTELEHPAVVAVGTGLRRGELLGLRWADVDLEAARLTVRRSVEMVGGQRHEKAPKTRNSARTIALPQFVLAALKAQRKAQNERRLVLGLGRDENAVVFDRADGEPWAPTIFGNTFRRTMKRAGLRVRLHDLRHSYATLALSSGTDLKTVSAALGHSAIGVTANVYLHAVESLQRDSADRLDALLSPTFDTSRKANLK
ncbi:MAG: tyrosine-type recombinase/integrase [Candidatus Baltobacteraceae bacterium]